MNNSVNVIAIVEGKTEKNFIESILSRYLAEKGIYIKSTMISKPGQKGGDVRFERVKNDVEKHIKQRKDTYITTFVDYYGLKKWPDLDKITKNNDFKEISNILIKAAQKEINDCFSEHNSVERFIPYVAMHEFEAMVFCDKDVLTSEIRLNEIEIDKILKKYKSPEEINNGVNTAPSKRLSVLSENKYIKTVHGIKILNKIGIEKIREKCPVFDNWLKKLESKLTI